MNILDVEVGTPEWLEARKGFFPASDAAAMMGDSKFTSRKQLLEKMKTGKETVFTGFQKKVVDGGHTAEANARAMAEAQIGEDLIPLMAWIELDGLKLSASFDGITEGHDYVWEHKLWNKTLAENIKSRTLEPHYIWQLEQQMLVAGINEATIHCSDGTNKNSLNMVYASVPERRMDLIQGWQKFQKDLETFVVEPKKEVVVAKEVSSLPAIQWKIEGSMIRSNLKDIIPVLRDRAEQEMSRILETDQDFADQDALNKIIKEARDKAKAVKKDVTGQFISYAEFEESMSVVDGILQKWQAQGEKAVKEQKELRKNAIVAEANDELAALIQQIDIAINPVNFRIIATEKADFLGVMKGKRTLTSWQEEVDKEFQRITKIYRGVEKGIQDNLTLFHTLQGDQYTFLFNDLNTIAIYPLDAFASTVKQRIQDHKAHLAQLVKDTAERVRQEEEERVAREKAAAEADALRKVSNGMEIPANAKAQLDTFEDMLEKARGAEVHDFPTKKAVVEERFELITLIHEWGDQWGIHDDACYQLEQIVRSWLLSVEVDDAEG